MKKVILSWCFCINLIAVFSQHNTSATHVCFSIPSSLKISDLDNLQISDGSCSITSFSFQLFNRWGQVVKESNSLTNPLIWKQAEVQKKGKSKKKKQNNSQSSVQEITQGQYFYIILFTVEGFLDSEKVVGNFSLF
jgi:hypothetical protein